MTEADVYRATVGELLENFRDALVAILPVVDRAMINYRDNETHRDWERLAEGMFDAFVRSPIDSDLAAIGGELPLARYDIDVGDYLGVSWLTTDVEAPHRGVLLRFLSDAAPFDKIQVVDIDPVTLRAGKRRTVATSEISLALYRRVEDGGAAIVTQIEAVE
jgi:hypothetical protein